MASPTLLEASFHRTVVLLLQHGPGGALGLVLNRASGMRVDEPLPAWAHLATPPQVMFHGGPVGPSGVVCLAAGSDAGGASHEFLFDEIGTLDLHQSSDDVVGVEAIRVYAGHAGWIPGQLEHEIEERGWIVVDRAPGDVFTTRPAELWAEVLARQPGIVALLSNYPSDVNLN